MGADDLERRVEETLDTLSESERAETVESAQAEADPIKDITAPLDGLPDDAPLGRVEEALRGLAFSLKGFDSLRCAIVREAVVKKLERFGITSPARMVDAAFQDGHSRISPSGAHGGNHRRDPWWRDFHLSRDHSREQG